MDQKPKAILVAMGANLIIAGSKFTDEDLLPAIYGSKDPSTSFYLKMAPRLRAC